jgi:hypothetical protein
MGDADERHRRLDCVIIVIVAIARRDAPTAAPRTPNADGGTVYLYDQEPEDAPKAACLYTTS